MATPSPTKRLDLLLRLSQELNASLDPETVLMRVRTQVPLLVRAERAVVLLTGSDQGSSEPGMQEVARRALADKQAVMDSPDGRACLCVPMFGREGALGALYADRAEKPFSEVDLELLTAIAASAAIALENARLHQSAQRRLERLDFLHRVSEQITATLDLQRVLDASVQAMQDLLSAKAASILILEGSELVFQVARGAAADTVKPIRIPVSQGLAGWVATHREPVIVNDAQNDPRHFTAVDKKSGFITQAILAVPVMINERVLGVVEVFNREGGFNKDDQDLLTTFASSVAFAIENARLYQVAVEKGRLERELQMARRVQASLIPAHVPQAAGWEFAGRWLPAREVSGDYYDFIPLESSGQQGMVIADVADKGMPAALFMAFVRSTLRATLFTDLDPAHAIAHANALICADAPDSMFVTLCYARLDPVTGRLTYVNAGHNPPLLLRAGASSFELLTRTGIALGADPDLPFTARSIDLAPGDLLTFYTDGVTDALTPAGEEYGMERLQTMLRSNAAATADEVILALEEDIRAFTAGRDPYDDITLLILKRTA